VNKIMLDSFMKQFGVEKQTISTNLKTKYKKAQLTQREARDSLGI